MTHPSTSLVVAVGLVAYVVGGIPTGWLLVRARFWGFDLRRYGSGNIGTSNVYRHTGIRVAAVVGPLQFLQGFLPVLATQALGLGDATAVLAAICAVIGNGWPIWLRLNGGRGIAVGTGAVAALTLPGLLLLLVCYAAGGARHRIAEGVLAGFVVLPALVFALGQTTVAVGACGLLLIVLLRRLEGVGADLERLGLRRHVVVDRLLHDRRPGRPLAGPRTDI